MKLKKILGLVLVMLAVGQPIFAQVEKAIADADGIT